MEPKRREAVLGLIHDQMALAVGCTEPAAVAYASALAAKELGCVPERITVSVSRNILKNGMGVCIPGTGMIGLPIAAVLGSVSGEDDALQVLGHIGAEELEQAQSMLDAGVVQVELSGNREQKLYIEVTARRAEHVSRVVIENAHTNVTLVEVDGEPRKYHISAVLKGENQKEADLSLEEIDEFVRTADLQELGFLRECIRVNRAASEEGFKNAYGMNLGRSMMDRMKAGEDTEEAWAQAVTCAAADARMGGCTLPVYALCGSGNQGLTATLPIVALGEKRDLPEETVLRALAYSILVTIHVKHHLGKLTALCACSVGASIGVACAMSWLEGGSFDQICHCIDNVIADVAGIICDGAKPGCTLKIATGITSAFRASMLAMKNHNAEVSYGIVGRSAERSIENLAALCDRGMASADELILDMLLCK